MAKSDCLPDISGLIDLILEEPRTTACCYPLLGTSKRCHLRLDNFLQPSRVCGRVMTSILRSWRTASGARRRKARGQACRKRTPSPPACTIAHTAAAEFSSECFCMIFFAIPSKSILSLCDLRYPMRRGRNFRSPGLRPHEQLEKRNVAWKKDQESSRERLVLFFPDPQFQQIDRAPEPPGEKAREFESADLGYGALASERGKHPDRPVSEGHKFPNTKRSCDIFSNGFPLIYGVLGCWRAGVAVGAVGNLRTITQRPDTRVNRALPEIRTRLPGRGGCVRRAALKSANRAPRPPSRPGFLWRFSAGW